MPRPKSELTKNGKAVGVRLTESEYNEWIKLGATPWLRNLLQESRDKNKTKVIKQSLSYRTQV
jgi:hypothetical protein